MKRHQPRYYRSHPLRLARTPNGRLIVKRARPKKRVRDGVLLSVFPITPTNNVVIFALPRANFHHPYPPFSHPQSLTHIPHTPLLHLTCTSLPCRWTSDLYPPHSLFCSVSAYILHVRPLDEDEEDLDQRDPVYVARWLIDTPDRIQR